MLRTPALLPILLVAVCLVVAPRAAHAQFEMNFDFGGADPMGDTDFGPGGEPVTVTAEVTPAEKSSGPGNAVLSVTAQIAPGWHVYSVTQPKGGPQRTRIELAPSEQYRLLGEFTPSPDYETATDEFFPGVEIQEHADLVVWSAPIEIVAGATAQSVAITGTVRGQACEEVCQPFELPFAVNADAPVVAATEPVPFEAAAGEFDLAKIDLGAEKSFGYYLYWAFIGGLILNLMPCVLPVIGLKVMSFVDQAGKSRLQAFSLNLWYALGILAVFWVLAALAFAIEYRWSDQGSTPWFYVAMSGLVLAMSLSLLGVWEIPIPGFLGSNKTQMAASREGVFGAWLKGVVTTLLAIPCTGPGMAVALGWSVGKPWTVIAAVFTAIGLGMASPYLIIGAFPGLVRFLPKPGMWMETFKQLMGFVLMGTVVYLLSLVQQEYVVPTLAMLTAIGLACWQYGKTPVTANASEKWQAYALCGAILMGGGVFSFGWLLPEVARPMLTTRVAAAATDRLKTQSDADPELTVRELLARASATDSEKWGAFSLEKLQALAVDQRKTVIVDFGASWCPNCHFLEKTVLQSDAVEQAIDASGVVTLFADYSDYPAEIRATLDSLRSQAVPVVAVFPGNDPYRPIVFRGGYTQQNILDAIAAAAGGATAKVAATPGN